MIIGLLLSNLIFINVLNLLKLRDQIYEFRLNCRELQKLFGKPSIIVEI